ncbi:DUF1905 domain-containing protein [Curtobacterium sp. Leaf261]|uniref:DUF1905 domain-containing protein n=1 Tax=Curtobacterium sp. Leaf261 TaxID=1736311 RepID=UPI0006F4FFB6|nr:DUF1905 domain-containing protein [Curtobacterium sp. Leaf261]KQO63702.1 hypothetical protein ASF23_05645 [Curtobacterium sp. Leaf261]
MELHFSGPLWYWRGPAPFHFVTVPADASAELAEIAPLVSYGWGMVPVRVRIGATTTTTALWPKDGGYIVPVKKALQTAEGLEIDDVVTVTLEV